MKNLILWLLALITVIILTIPALICVTLYWILIVTGFSKSDANKAVDWIDKVHNWAEKQGV